jgi:hypothetical protein
MRPLNLDNSPCTPTSSNCVIWSGPDLDCIKLCTGDTISDVVAKLATELCTILDTLNVSNYDLACLNLNTCAPSDFEQLIQLLIDKVCALENAPVDPTNPPSTACPTDCIVATLGCLIGPDEPDGSDTLINYIQGIAQRLCNLINEVGLAQDAIALLDVKVTALENAPVPTFIIPSFTLSCSIGTIPPVLAASSTQAIDVVLRRFINEEWCPYKAVFGTYTDLSNSIGSQCITGTDTAQALKYTFPGTQMQIAYPSYVGTPVTLSDAVNNLWIALCDVRNAGVQITDVAAGPNIIVTSATVIVGADEVTTYTVESTTNPLDTLNEGITLTTNTASMNFVGDLVNATTVGDNVTVTVNTFEGMLAQDSPANLNSVAFGLGNVLCLQPVQVIAQIYDDANAYDPLTGIWTCPTTGRYNLSCYAHYTKDSADGWYDSVNPGGMFGVGVFSTTSCNFYCANWMTVMGIQKHIDITAQAIGMSIVAGTQLSVKVLNQTGYNYTSVTGDAIRFSIERIK